MQSIHTHDAKCWHLLDVNTYRLVLCTFPGVGAEIIKLERRDKVNVGS